MKYLGIDYGSKRVGISVSDDSGSIAFPKVVLENNKELIKKIKKICKEEDVKSVVLGESLDKDGTPNQIHTAASSFAKDFLVNTNLSIHWESEFMTSHHSAIGNKKGEFKKGILDAHAASLILQRFLDKRNNK